MGVAALYPHANPPPQQPSPWQIIPALQSMQQFQARRAVGNAFQQGVRPDGTYDPSVTLNAIGADPSAALAAPEGITTALQARQQNIQNSTAALEYGVKSYGALAAPMAALNQKPNLTMEDAYNLAGFLSRLPGANASVINGWLAGVNAGNVKDKIAQLTTYGMGPAAAAGQQPGQVGANNQPTVTTAGKAAFTGPGGAAPGQNLTTQPPPQAAADQAEYIADQSKSPAIMAGIRPLQQALPLVRQLNDPNFGPLSKGWTEAKAALSQLGIIDPNTSDTAVRQELGKYLLQYSANVKAAGRSDEGLAAAVGSNPSADTMTKPAVIATLTNQVARDRMDAALPMAAPGFQGYQKFKTGYYAGMDPDAFKFDLMTPQEQKAKLASLKGNPAATAKFRSSLAIADKVMSPDQGQ